MKRRSPCLKAKLLKAAVLTALFCTTANLWAEGFRIPSTGRLFVQLVSTAGAGEWQFGVGSSSGDCRILVANLVPTPALEVQVGVFTAGDLVHFCMFTRFAGASAWAFSSGSDLASLVAFTDRDNSLRLGGSIIRQTSPSTWTMHLDDSVSYLYDDDDDDLVIRLRMEPPPSISGTLIDFEPPFPVGLRPMGSFINGTSVPFDARITNQYQNLGVVVSGAALVPLGQGHATSGVYGIAPINPGTGALDYRSPISFTFTTLSGARLSADYFSISTDRAGGSRNTVLLSAFGPGGRLVGSTTFVETTGGQQIELRGIGLFESVTVQMTTGSPDSSGIGFDLVSFGPVVLTGGGSPSALLTSPSSLAFSYRMGGPLPVPQSLSVSSSASLAFAASTSGGNWLRVFASSGATPGSLTVSVNPTGLETGTYSASIVIFASAATNPITSITVTLIVIADAPLFTLAGIVNAASYARGLVPGSIVTIFGVNLSTGVSGIEQVGGALSYRGVTVMIGGRMTPIINIASIAGIEQVSVQVPFETLSGTTTTVEINNNGRRSSVADVPVFSTQPGIFEISLADSSRVAAVLHADGSLVTPLNPARKGEVVSVWITGAGFVAPYVSTGVPGPFPPSTITAETVVGIGSTGCEIVFSGYAPFLIGVYQINFRVNDSVPSGNAVSISVRVGSAFSQTASVAVR